MGEPQQIKVKVESDSNRPRSHIGRVLTLDLLKGYIRRLDLDEYTTNGLIQMASRYPQAALPTFRRKINLMIQRVRAQRQQEEPGDEVHEQAEAVDEVVERTEQAPPRHDPGPQRLPIRPEDLADDD